MGLLEALRPPPFLVVDEDGAILFAAPWTRDAMRRIAAEHRPRAILSIVVARSQWQAAQRSREALSRCMGRIVRVVWEATTPPRPARLARTPSPGRRLPLRARH